MPTKDIKDSDGNIVSTVYTLTKHNSDKLDMFSEEVLTIAGEFKQRFPDTWKILYDNRGMPDLVQFVAQHTAKQVNNLLTRLEGQAEEYKIVSSGSLQAPIYRNMKVIPLSAIEEERLRL